MAGMAKGGVELAFGDFGIQALDSGLDQARQMKPRVIAMTRHVKRGGKVWIRSFPTSPSPKSPRRPAWARARATPILGRVVNPGASFRARGVRRDAVRARRWSAPFRSCPSRPSRDSARTHGTPEMTI